MKVTFSLMTQLQAEDIAHNWHYDGMYSFYDIEADEEDLQEFLDPSKRGDSVFVVKLNDQVIGFYSFNYDQETAKVDIGLGLRPDLTGKGLGKSFLQAGLKFVKETYHPTAITLSVAAFNKRAIKVYHKSGFEIVEKFDQYTNGGNYPFIKMAYNC